MNDTENTQPWSQPLIVADLPTRRAKSFSVKPGDALLKTIAEHLGLRGLRKLRFEGEITPDGQTGWLLNAKLGATILQDCVISLERVTTRIDEDISRQYVAKLPEVEEGSEFEIPGDEPVEQLQDVIDPGEVMVEALTLSVPEFPRVEGAALAETNFTKPGITPMDDAEARPFSGLKALQKKLENGSD